MNFDLGGISWITLSVSAVLLLGMLFVIGVFFALFGWCYNQFNSLTKKCETNEVDCQEKIKLAVNNYKSTYETAVEGLRNELNLFRIERKEDKKQMRDNESDWDGKFREMRITLNSTLVKLDDVSMENAKLLNKINNLENIEKELRDEITKLKRENEGLFDKVNSLERERSRLNSDIQLLKNEYESMQRDLREEVNIMHLSYKSKSQSGNNLMSRGGSHTPPPQNARSISNSEKSEMDTA